MKEKIMIYYENFIELMQDSRILWQNPETSSLINDNLSSTYEMFEINISLYVNDLVQNNLVDEHASKDIQNEIKDKTVKNMVGDTLVVQKTLMFTQDYQVYQMYQCDEEHILKVMLVLLNNNFVLVRYQFIYDLDAKIYVIQQKHIYNFIYTLLFGRYKSDSFKEDKILFDSMKTKDDDYIVNLYKSQIFLKKLECT